MKKVQRTLQWLMLVTLSLSGLLLGMGQGDFEPFFVAVFGALASMFFVDWLKWFKLKQWQANSLAILVTAFTVVNFYFTTDSVRHLLGVGKLLVYLQTILLFQRKTSRVYWQVIVLSLLQIVVGAVFNLGFEGGVLFILYMLFAGLTMMMIHLFQDRQVVTFRNQEYARSAARPAGLGGTTNQPIAFSDVSELPKGLLSKMARNFVVFGLGSLAFSILLFYFLPRDSSSWAGPREVSMRRTGHSQELDPKHTDLILLSSQLQMNVRYLMPDGETTFKPVTQPYLRGLTLSNIEIRDNHTHWVAPPYQVRDQDYRILGGGDRLPATVTQEITLEPTEDPLLFSAMPAYHVSGMDSLSEEFAFCWPLGSVTREKIADKLSVTHYRYTLKVPVLPSEQFFSSWPYQARDRRSQVPLTPQGDLGTYKWLTYLDRSRYPVIVETAQQLAERAGDNHLVLARNMERWFSTDQGFRYTLDFRNVTKNPDIDPVEDFVANFRVGHCTYYASALALMLRSQGIPSRVVTGFRGGDINEFSGDLDVEARHAHAWVEAYVRPEDCTRTMIETGQASRRRGAWVRLDATPEGARNATLMTRAGDALDFAKSLWRDYVLGLQSENRSRVIDNDSLKLSGLLRVLDLDWWQSSISSFQKQVSMQGGWKKYIPHGLGLLAILAFVMIWLKKNQPKSAVAAGPAGHSQASAGWLRRTFGKVLKPLSPRLAEWVGGTSGDPDEIAFYENMLQLLEKSGFQRLPQQTQREFESQVRHNLPGNAGDEVGTLTKTITDFYYFVRFGDGRLSEGDQTTIDESLDSLRLRLAELNEASPNPAQPNTL